eukprot:COSAG01_NODE_5089_length_4494_cov_2.160865_5_plen_212_part_00
MHFDTHVSALQAGLFLEKLQQQLQFTGLVVGYDFHFGANREGSPQFAQAWCEQRGLSFYEVPCFKQEDKAVKSGLIRQTLAAGNFQLALDYLGHAYVLSGKVVPGDGRGKSLGFPTANLAIHPEKCCPLPGVYRATVKALAKTLTAIVYIGSKPTFSGQGQHVEVHIPDFDADLYGQHLQLLLDKQIRGEKHFNNKDELIKQIKIDLEQLS